MLSLWTLLNEQGLKGNGDTPHPPKPSPSLEESVAVGAEPHTRGLIVQKATAPEALQEHAVPKNTGGKRKPAPLAANTMLWRIQHLDS